MSGLLTRRPALRWVAPGAALAVVATGSQIAAHWPADAATNLPPRTAQQLLVDLQRAQPSALSGTVKATSSLGLPQLPESVTSGTGNSSPLALLAGSHTAKVWYDGKTSARVALLGDGSETDLVSNGGGLWLWQSADKSVLHVPAPSGGTQRSTDHDKDPQLPAELSTPEGVASWALRMLDPSTAVTTSSNERIAGRAAYQLVLTPKTAGTKIGSVRISIDAANQTPLRAQVFAKGASNPAINVGFTSIDYGKQPASRFDFTPPPGAKVTQATPHPGKPKSGDASAATTNGSATPPKVVGKDWASVVVGKLPPKQTVAKDDSSLQQALRLLPEASGSWGRGHLLNTALFTAVITDDGRYAVGAVPASSLYAALGRS
ncbi:LolA family protein [Flexivirga meconopsidis]|uniref:LolA family protein n=1 Tax=Flexivirga meconopsidis TaxID=2977121 RepID=UPI00223EF2F0|nr:hypothetical protein [Flexivirga meconopsidis]